VCCSVLQCVAVCCIALCERLSSEAAAMVWCVYVCVVCDCCSLLQCLRVVCCSVMQCVAMRHCLQKAFIGSSTYGVVCVHVCIVCMCVVRCVAACCSV